MARKKRTRGTYGGGTVYERSAGRWTVAWRENGKRRYKHGLASKEEAERVRAKIAGLIAQGRTGLPPDPKTVPTLDAFASGDTGWLARRKKTHRAGAEDEYRWKKHLRDHFGHLRPSQVDQAAIRRFVELKLAEGLNPATIRILIAILSGLFVELVEDGRAQANPCRALPRAIRRLMKPTHDPRTTPFLERGEDVRRVFLALEEPLNVAFAIGAMAGLRTGEVFALRWEHVDLGARRIHVRESVKGPLKDKDSRMVPILDGLLPVLRERKAASGGKGLIVPPLRRDGKKIDKATPGNFLRAALKACELQREGLGWYECTRHTFASQWVMAGGSIEKLKEILGHYSVTMTERYAHLKPELFMERDLGTISVDLSPAAGEVTALHEREPIGSQAHGSPG